MCLSFFRYTRSHMHNRARGPGSGATRSFVRFASRSLHVWAGVGRRMRRDATCRVSPPVSCVGPARRLVHGHVRRGGYTTAGTSESAHYGATRLHQDTQSRMNTAVHLMHHRSSSYLRVRRRHFMPQCLVARVQLSRLIAIFEAREGNTGIHRGWSAAAIGHVGRDRRSRTLMIIASTLLV